jgi:hypothetical protein
MGRAPENGCAFEFEILKASLGNSISAQQSDDAPPSLIARVEYLRKLELKLLRGSVELRRGTSAWIIRCRLAK